MNKRILIISQVIPQWYVDLLSSVFDSDDTIDIITGSKVKGNVISSPKHDPTSLKSRLISWVKHYRFMMKWIRRNKHIKYDLIFAVSNPPINPYIGLKLKKVYNAPFVYMNWDLYPQVIRSSIKNPISSICCKLWSSWNSINFHKIDKIITIGDVMASSLNEDIKNKVDVSVIPIGVDTQVLKPIDKSLNKFCVENDLVNKFVVLYSGKMGIGHNIELILEAAKKLEHNSNIIFVFIGFGPKYKTVEDYISANSSINVRLYPLQDEEMFPFSMACGDIGIVTQESSMAHLFMPSKVYSMMACGEAIVGLCTEHDDLNTLVKCDCVGLTVTSNSAEELVDVITKLSDDNVTLNSYKKQSRKTAVEKYELSIIKSKYIQLFDNVFDTSRSSKFANTVH